MNPFRSSGGARTFFAAVAAVMFLIAGRIPAAAQASPAAHSDIFPVAPHSDVSIEWWYLYAHLTTKSGHRYAVVTSFFRFGNAQAMKDASGATHQPQPQSHYMIYAVTDETDQTHKTYSLADRNSLRMLQQLAALALMANPSNKQASKLLALASENRFPPPTQLIDGACHVGDDPNFGAVYGKIGSLKAEPRFANTFHLNLGGSGTPHVDLTFVGAKPPMYVGGDGNTGVYVPTDMKYVSLTRCNVTGTIDDGNGPETVASAQGWFDHQWGDTWTTTSVGWDWWGVQLADGRDILFFRQRHMDTGEIFSPMATIEDASGNLTVTRNITFTPDPASVWLSPRTGIRYPLNWSVGLPDQGLTLDISPVMDDQEMPVMASGGAIWEGSVKVDAYAGLPGNVDTNGPVKAIPGVGYQELVGYASPVVADQLSKP